MSTAPSFIISAWLLVSASTAIAGATEKTREFRPLEAKKVIISPAAQVTDGLHHEVKADSFVSEAWERFDAKDWTGAMSGFVSALEADPECREAAEGLAMSIYHTGDYASAYRLGEELKIVMPNVRRMIAETALTDVRGLIADGEFADARSFLAHFPATGPTLAYAHNLVQTADNLTTSVENTEAITMNSAASGESLVRN